MRDVCLCVRAVVAFRGARRIGRGLCDSRAHPDLLAQLSAQSLLAARARHCFALTGRPLRLSLGTSHTRPVTV